MSRRLSLFVVFATFTAVAVAVPPARGATGECVDQDRTQALRDEQERVLAQFGRFESLENPADLALLAAAGFSVHPHRAVSLGGIGWSAFNPSAPQFPPQPGRPNLLFYSPSGEDVTDPEGFDFPYRLVGWGYVPLQYNPDQHPIFTNTDGGVAALGACLTRDDWFAHERGLHPFETGGIDNRPPVEEVHGESEGRLSDPEPVTDCQLTGDRISPRGDICHPRSWDIHFWTGAKGTPKLPILNPGKKIPGIDSQIGKAFFHPVYEPDSVGG